MSARHAMRALPLCAVLTTACVAEVSEDEAIEGQVLRSTAWAGDRQDDQVGACFVLGPLPSSATQADVDNVRNTIDEWTEGDTALDFVWSSNVASMTTLTFGADSYLTSCSQDAAGNFNEPYRIYLDDGSRPQWSPVQLPRDLTIPGCAVAEGIGSQAEDAKGNPIQDPASGLWQVEDGYMWGSSPDDQRANTTCLYTLHMGLGQARNNYLHEAGHGLGLAHEQERSDAVCNNGGSPPSGPDGNTKITEYDRDSVMHYVWSCPDGTTVAGNWGNTGLSDSDKLAMEMMHPENDLARVFGQTVGWAGGGGLWAASTWEYRGAVVSDATSIGGLKNVAWSTDGARLSARKRPSTAEWASLSVGRHRVQLAFDNKWDDHFETSVTVEVLASKADYDRRAAAVLPFL